VTGDKARAVVLTEISLILAAVFWGANYAATKFAALSMPPVSIVAVRFAVAGLLMYCVLRVLEPESRLARKDLLPMAGLGCLGVVIGQTTFTFGVSMTSAANTGFIFASRSDTLAGFGCRANRNNAGYNEGEVPRARGGIGRAPVPTKVPKKGRLYERDRRRFPGEATL
jgi:hypothetical protein